MSSLRKILIIVAAGLIILSSWLFLRLSNTPDRVKTITVSQNKLQVEIADTPALREKGLSDRESLCPNCGLLFIFDQLGIYPFWMRRMYFDIDILWLKGDEIVDLTCGAKAPGKEEFDRPKIFYQSKAPVDRVLEVNAGWVEKNKIKIGDIISFGK